MATRGGKRAKTTHEWETPQSFADPPAYPGIFDADWENAIPVDYDPQFPQPLYFGYNFGTPPLTTSSKRRGKVLGRARCIEV